MRVGSRCTLHIVESPALKFPSLSLSLSLSSSETFFFLGLKDEELGRDRRGSEEDGVVFQAFFFLKGFLSTANSKPAQCLHGVV